MKSISVDEWSEKMKKVSIEKKSINELIMNYLVIEGYKDAAEKFSKEANIQPDVDLNSIHERMKIRHSMTTGNVELAMEQVNELDPEILDSNPKLYFHLQQQRFIELIRQDKLTEALLFAQDELAPCAEDSLETQADLEKTMALLAFPFSNTAAASPVSYLLDPAHRLKRASELNAAILTAQSQEKDPKLPALLKMSIWAQEQLQDKLNVPKLKNLVTAELEMSDGPISSSGNATASVNS